MAPPVVIVTGVALLTFGLFGSAVVAGPPGVKLLVVAALLYGAVAGVRGARRARR